MNKCSLIGNKTATGFNIQATRYLLLTDLFCLFIIYLIILVILKKSVHNLKSEDSGSRLEERERFLKVLVVVFRNGSGSTC